MRMLLADLVDTLRVTVCIPLDDFIERVFNANEFWFWHLARKFQHYAWRLQCWLDPEE